MFVFNLNVQYTKYTLRIYILLPIKKYYFIHFCCLFLKSWKAFSVSLIVEKTKQHKTERNQIIRGKMPLFILWHMWEKQILVNQIFLENLQTTCLIHLQIPPKIFDILFDINTENSTNEGTRKRKKQCDAVNFEIAKPNELKIHLKIKNHLKCFSSNFSVENIKSTNISIQGNHHQMT